MIHSCDFQLHILQLETISSHMLDCYLYNKGKNSFSAYYTKKIGLFVFIFVQLIVFRNPSGSLRHISSFLPWMLVNWHLLGTYHVPVTTQGGVTLGDLIFCSAVLLWNNYYQPCAHTAALEGRLRSQCAQLLAQVFSCAFKACSLQLTG